ncbi:hypothetical protein THAOC_33299, partial [Thalassiosira oceanica]
MSLERLLMCAVRVANFGNEPKFGPLLTCAILGKKQKHPLSFQHRFLDEAGRRTLASCRQTPIPTKSQRQAGLTVSHQRRRPATDGDVRDEGSRVRRVEDNSAPAADRAMADVSPPPADADDYGEYWLSSNPKAYAPHPEEPFPDCDVFRGLLEKYWKPSKPPSGARIGKKAMHKMFNKELKKRKRMVARVFHEYIYAKTAPGEGDDAS